MHTYFLIDLGDLVLSSVLERHFEIDGKLIVRWGLIYGMVNVMITIVDEKCLVQRKLAMTVWDEMWTDWKVEVVRVETEGGDVWFQRQCQLCDCWATPLTLDCSPSWY